MSPSLLICVLLLAASSAARSAVIVPIKLRTRIGSSGTSPRQEKHAWKEAEMSQMTRGITFWSRVIHIYSSYKLCQFRSFVTRRSKDDRQVAMDRLHRVNSDRLLDMCLHLRGFYIKTGQFLGTRYDFMPRVYCEKLSTLSDSVPAMPPDVCKRMIEHELNGEIDDLFIDIDLENVLGAASIAQVHKGTWKATGETVAIKLQYPNAELKMRKDLSNIRFLAEFLQKTELKFDVVSAVKELQSQIKFEFDFKREAANMDFAKSGLRKVGVKNVAVPRSVLASDRVLVMSYIEGTNLSQLSEIRERKAGRSSSSSSAVPAVMKKAVGKKLFQQLAAVYGAMFFTLNKMHADPNPGNISLQGTSIGILDWGQVKDVTSSLKRRFSNLVLAFNARDRDAICKALFALGVKVTYPEDKATVEGIAVTMLDTRKMAGFPCDPFDENCASLRNPIIHMPPEIYFIVRSVQMLRGLSSAFDLDFSLAEQWGALAEQYADEAFIAAKAKART